MGRWKKMRINLTLSQLKLNSNHIFYINASLNALFSLFWNILRTKTQVTKSVITKLKCKGLSHLPVFSPPSPLDGCVMHLTHSCLQLCLRFCSANIQENHHISRAAYIIWDLIFKLPMDSSYGWNEDTTPTHLQHHHKTEPNLISLSWADNCFPFSMPYK